ncbi:class I SAM-dependent methyltransferase [Lysobacter sp. KIS68-7]|uniref:class I SAM-dependent methyltransferase n=1 Tax=Lysobacter sp. KIS68-7 TaxID=2904252 RepID=UPI001E52FFEC|nr:class I SAM-dependent methyltransferase [Lysobacter sp. KIS68-7]UHQ19916.1 class I SAM-dependent methyltransferase [Lysobacter sp. KIS68-7]
MAWIATLGPSRHVLADLYPSRLDIQRMDLEAIPFEEASFDFVIANHVLEHVVRLDRATSEIARVLVPGGHAILQAPWCQGIDKTIEDHGVRSEEARLQLYGQADHVRLFGRDIYERIAASGLQALPITHAAALGDVDPDKFGVNPQEDLMLFLRS